MKEYRKDVPPYKSNRDSEYEKDRQKALGLMDKKIMDDIKEAIEDNQLDEALNIFIETLVDDDVFTGDLFDILMKVIGKEKIIELVTFTNV